MRKLGLILGCSALIFSLLAWWSAPATAGYSGLAPASVPNPAWAWGHNLYGQLGDGSTTTRLYPVSMSGLSGATAVATKNYHSLALLSDGTRCGPGATTALVNSATAPPPNGSPP